jgi:hypothetical protein
VAWPCDTLSPMSESARPGGLTALAVINFILGGLGLINVPALGMLLAMHLGTFGQGDKDMREATKEASKLVEAAGVPLFVTIMALHGLLAVLLILSGIGYLKLKRFLGRVLGNAYAIVAIATSVLWIWGTSSVKEGGMDLGVLAGLVYPLITLFLINTTFREDFTN